MSSMKYKFIFVETLRGILLTHLNSKLDIRKMPLGPFASKCLVCQFIFNIFHSVILDLLYWIYIFYLSFILYDISSLRYVCTYVIYDINRDMAIVLKKKNAIRRFITFCNFCSYHSGCSMPLEFVENHEHLPVQKLANAFDLNPK